MFCFGTFDSSAMIRIFLRVHMQRFIHLGFVFGFLSCTIMTYFVFLDACKRIGHSYTFLPCLIFFSRNWGWGEGGVGGGGGGGSLLYFVFYFVCFAFVVVVVDVLFCCCCWVFSVLFCFFIVICLVELEAMLGYATKAGLFNRSWNEHMAASSDHREFLAGSSTHTVISSNDAHEDGGQSEPV